MSQAELHSHITTLLSRKLPLQQICAALSDISEERVTETYDALIIEAFDIDLVFDAAA